MGLPRLLSLNSENELSNGSAAAFRKLRHATLACNGKQLLKTGKRCRVHCSSKIWLRKQVWNFVPRPIEPFVVSLDSEDGENFATLRFTEKRGGSAAALRSTNSTRPYRDRGFPGSPALIPRRIGAGSLRQWDDHATARIYHVPKWRYA